MMQSPHVFVKENTFDDQNNGDGHNQDEDREVSFLREKIVEVVREGDARDTQHLLGLSVSKRLVSSFDRSSRWSLLHFSCSRGFLDITRMLLEAGANPLTAVDKRGKTCLHVAIERDARDIIALLLDRNSVQQWPRRSNLTLGQTAARAGRTVAMQLLLLKGLDPNERGSQGETPLHCAARHGHHRVIEVLLRHGADVSAREEWAGRTPLHYACQGGSLKTAQYLQTSRIDPVDAAIFASKAGTAAATSVSTSMLTMRTFLPAQAATTLIVDGGADAHLRDHSEAAHTCLEAAVVSGHRGLSHRLVLLLENRRRDDERREAAAQVAKSTKREAVLRESAIVRRRVMILKGTVARKRLLVRMEKGELMEKLRAQTARASYRLRNLEAQRERLTIKQAKQQLNDTRPGTCPATMRTSTRYRSKSAQKSECPVLPKTSAVDIRNHRREKGYSIRD